NSGGNYSVSTVSSTSGVVAARALTISAAANSKGYDGGTSASTTPTVAGLQGSDTVTGLAETYDNKNVGTGKTLSVSAYTVNDGNSGTNYAVTTVGNTSGVISARTLMVSASGVNKVYDGTTSATVTLSDDRVAGDVFSDAFTSATFANKNVGN